LKKKTPQSLATVCGHRQTTAQEKISTIDNPRSPHLIQYIVIGRHNHHNQQHQQQQKHHQQQQQQQQQPITAKKQSQPRNNHTTK
jgi:hypothetical protein